MTLLSFLFSVGLVIVAGLIAILGKVVLYIVAGIFIFLLVVWAVLIWRSAPSLHLDE